jgi:arsenite methyltransferase
MVSTVLRRLRGGLKGFSYSGFRRDRWQDPDRVIAALALREGQRVADLGAGAGYFTFPLARAVGPQGLVYAVDTDSDMSSLIAEKATSQGWSNVVTVAASPHDPALPQAVDLVLLVNAFHHLPEPAAYLTTLATYLRPGGRVAVVEARPKRLLFGHGTDPDTITSTMAKAGYTLVDQHDFLVRQSFLVFEQT